jgi:hypothetical protein
MTTPELTFSAHQDRVCIYFDAKTEEEGRILLRKLNKKYKHFKGWTKICGKLTKWNYVKHCDEVYYMCSYEFSCHNLKDLISL